MKAFIPLLLIVTASLWLTGCASTESRSQELKLGMSQADVTQIMGSDYTTVAARLDADGTPVSVIKYELNRKEPLFLYFRQDKLVQWGDTSLFKALPEPEKPK
jgi:hypothetical protein